MQQNKLLIIIIIVAILGFAGAGYWYFEVYQPRQLAKELIVIYRDFQISMQNNLVTNPNDESSLKKGYMVVIKNTRTKLNQLKPPKQMALLHKDFMVFLDAAEHFMTVFRSGPFNQAINDAEKNQEKLGNDLDNKMQELIRAYP